MRIVITQIEAPAVAEAVSKADATSFRLDGSHDDNICVVAVNGAQRSIRNFEFRHWKVGRSSERKGEDPGPLPVIEEIATAAILETRGHNGSNQRDRSHLRLFVRRSDAIFLVLDIMEVGPEAGNVPFKALSLKDAILQARRKISVKIEDNLHDDIWWGNGGKSCSGIRSWNLGRHIGADEWKFNPENHSLWFQRAAEETGNVLREIRSLAGRFGEVSSFRHTAAVWKLLWPETPLGDLMKNLSLQMGTQVETELVIK
ncbi:MAG: hypothetical protein Q7S01_00310 [bacterium]|nr:hypothetical protein [bacterium]